jgi:1,4-dihydroxy-2-naphthoate octaprenyltransferase
MRLPTLKALFIGIRPKTLTMALMPILLAASLCWHDTASLDVWVLVVIVLSTLSIQIGTNLHNDAQDHLNGTDSQARIGPTRITQAGLASAVQTKNAAHLFFLIVLLSGIYLVVVGGLPILLIGIASLMAGYAYSCGTFPISRGPFGELCVLVFFGMIAVAASYYLLTGQWSNLAWILGFVIGLPACAILLINNYRDLETDQLSGRKTLAILLGNTWITPFLTLLLLAPYVILLLIPKLFLIAYLGLMPTLIVIYALIRLRDKSVLNRCFANSSHKCNAHLRSLT